jgi:hypothetical protein
MGGMTDFQAFKEVGLDAAVTLYLPALGEVESPDWRIRCQEGSADGYKTRSFTIETPEGALSYAEGYNDYTTWLTERPLKNDEDILLLKKYRPLPRLDREAVRKTYDEIGDDGILRMHVCGINGAGCWQEACNLYGPVNMIMATFDKPDWVREYLDILLNQKLRYIDESLKGTKIDLIETGGGEASDTVISPDIFRNFCLPFDIKINDELRAIGQKSVYHTCGGMMGLLDLIPRNGADASETLSPPGIGGNITDPQVVKQKMGDKMALIGGLDQLNILTKGTREAIRWEVFRLFEGYGTGGGYILSTCDHFFETPKQNLIWYAEAAKECVY